MYHLYHTPAIVLGSHPHKEADKVLALFTKEFGLIYAHASGVRLLASKLRFSLQDFSCADVVLIRGKEVWRLTNAQSGWNVYTAVKDGSSHRMLLARLGKLLKRLLPGEEKNDALFEVVSQGLEFLKFAREEELPNFEAVIVLRVLHHLGYIGKEASLTPFLESMSFGGPLIASIEPIRRKVITEINRSLEASQL